MAWQDIDLPPFVEHPPAGLDVVSASDAIRAICGWHIAPVITEVFVVDDPFGRPDIYLPTLHIQQVTACTVAGVALTPAELADLDWSSAGYLGRGQGKTWPTRRRSVTVTVQHGYTRVPPVLAAMATELAGRMLSPAGLVQQTSGQRSETYQRGLIESDLAVLDRYLLPAI